MNILPIKMEKNVIFKYLKCKIKGHFNKFKTGNCGLHLYYDGCNCDECNTKQKIESAKLGVNIKL